MIFIKNRSSDGAPIFLLYNENHAIVAWFKKGFADTQKKVSFLGIRCCAKGSLREGAPDGVG